MLGEFLIMQCCMNAFDCVHAFRLVSYKVSVLLCKTVGQSWNTALEKVVVPVPNVVPK